VQLSREAVGVLMGLDSSPPSSSIPGLLTPSQGMAVTMSKPALPAQREK